MKVIFLDIDGVLNNWRTTTTVAGRYIGLDPELVARFQALLERVDACVVLSSTWRLLPELRAAVEAEIAIADVTPHFPGEPRGVEIDAWLAHHPEVERYAIIDDHRDMLAGQTAFFTSPVRGLTEEVAEAVVGYLSDDERRQP